MLLIRRLLQFALGCICVLLLFMMFDGGASHPSRAELVGSLIFFILIILVLGPWWPSPDKVEKWKFDLPTDNRNVAACIFGVIYFGYSFYTAWEIYMQPPKVFKRIFGLIAAIDGVNGVIAFWALNGCIGIFVTLSAHNRLKRS